VDAAKTGSDAAFAALVSRYQQRLLRFLVTRCRSQADAEDALQDTFVSAYRYLHSFDARWRFSTWIYRIGIRNAMRVASSPSAPIDDLQDPHADPLQDCIVRSDRENLWKTAKTALSDEAFTALWLRYVEDMSIKEIAAAMERTASWTKVTLLRARGRVGAALEDAGAAAEQGEVYG
jgi:RNA polymerase sigma-70 factor (ECF subfamily)